MTNTEVERIAELCWRAYSDRHRSELWPGSAHYADDWRTVARAVIADRAAHPPDTDDATGELRAKLADARVAAAELTDTLARVRAERDAAHARSVAAGNERDALRQQLRDQAAEAEELVEQGRQAERDEIVRWMFDRRIFVTVPHTTAELLAIIQRETEWREKDRQKRIGAVEANRTVSEARAERDAIQSRLDAIANREPTNTEPQHPAEGIPWFNRVSILKQLLRDAREALKRARAYKGYNCGPLAEPWVSEVLKRLDIVTQESGEEGRIGGSPPVASAAAADQRAPAPAPTSEDLPPAPSCTRCMDLRLVQADEFERSGRAAKQSAQVLALVRATPGLSSAELAARHGLDRHMVARRLPEAARVGLITRREIGAQEVTWWPR